ncbi:MAG: amidohydrolase family protein [Chloroflexi bacterium]|nr:amidohydrolase family protein [Chloroflexota bacterium]
MTIPIIDTHQHLWDLSKVDYPWIVPETGPLYRTYLPAELEPQIEEAGVTATIMVQSANSYTDTVYMLDQTDAHDWMVGVVGWVPLLNPEETGRALERFTQNPNFKGMRHTIHGEPDSHWLLQEPIYESLQLLADAGLPFDVVATTHEHLECVSVVGGRIPNLKMVIDHLAQPPFEEGEPGQWGEDMRICAQNPNVYAKISGLGTASGDLEGWTADSVRDLVNWTIDLFGVDRCMCGGDWPVSVLAGGYVKAWTAYKQILSERPIKEQERILNGTAQAFYSVSLPK